MQSDDSLRILLQTREHARRLWDMLQRQEAELAAADSIDPVVKKSGLAAVRRAIASARRLDADAHDALCRHKTPYRPSLTDIDKGLSQ